MEGISAASATDDFLLEGLVYKGKPHKRPTTMKKFVTEAVALFKSEICRKLGIGHTLC